jgi:hypothetical protein
MILAVMITPTDHSVEKAGDEIGGECMTCSRLPKSSEAVFQSWRSSACDRWDQENLIAFLESVGWSA